MIGLVAVLLAGVVLTGSDIPALTSALDSSRVLQVVDRATPALLDGLLERLR